MTKRKGISVLITLVLAAAIVTALAAEARAAAVGGRSVSVATTLGSKAPRPGVCPMSGEPDYPNGKPLPPKVGACPTGGNGPSLTLRIHWLVRTWLGSMPKSIF